MGLRAKKDPGLNFHRNYTLTVDKCILKDLLTLISIVLALDPVPAKCIINCLIKVLLTLIYIVQP